MLFLYVIGLLNANVDFCLRHSKVYVPMHPRVNALPLLYECMECILTDF